MLTPFTLAVTGASGSGKTRTVAALVATLNQRGVRVATVKHAAHGHVAPPETTDSERYLAAGANPSAVIGDGECTVRFTYDEPHAELAELAARWCGDAEIVIAEGFKSSDVPKVLVHGGADPITMPDGVFAHVASETLVSVDEPVFTPDTNGVSGLVDLILQQASSETARDARLYVDGTEVELGNFPARALKGMAEGFLGSLKGLPSGGSSITIRINRA